MIKVNNFQELEEYVQQKNIELTDNEVIKIKNDYVVYARTKQKNSCEYCYFSSDCFPFGDCCNIASHSFKKISEIEALVLSEGDINGNFCEQK